MRHRREAFAVAIAIAVLLAGAAFAQSLPRELDRVAARLPQADRARLLQRQQALLAMTPGERDALRARVAAWEALPAPERRRQRETWEAWRALPAAERDRMRVARAAFDALPAAEQAALRASFDALDDQLRRGWLLGPTLGADWPRLHALLSQVGADEQQPLVAALRGLSAQGRSDLAVLAQRTPPAERDALRRNLLALPADARDGWLRSAVDPP